MTGEGEEDVEKTGDFTQKNWCQTSLVIIYYEYVLQNMHFFIQENRILMVIGYEKWHAEVRDENRDNHNGPLMGRLSSLEKNKKRETVIYRRGNFLIII